MSAKQDLAKCIYENMKYVMTFSDFGAHGTTLACSSALALAISANLFFSSEGSAFHLSPISFLVFNQENDRRTRQVTTMSPK